MLSILVLTVWAVAGVYGDQSTVELTAVQRAWLAEHRTIRFGYDPSWPPFSFRDQGNRLTGIDIELLERLAGRLGVEFVPLQTQSWSETYARAVNREVDILVSTSEDQERAKHFLFTQPYLSFPLAIITRNDAPPMATLAALRGRRVAAVRDYVATLEMQRDHPEIETVLTGTMEEAMLMVSAGHADAVATNLANASFVIKTQGLTNLRIAGLLPYTFSLRFAVRQDWPILRDILDQGVTSISLKEKQEITDRWVRIDYANVIRWDTISRWALGLGSAVALIILAIAWHNRRLQRELAERLRVQRVLEETRDRLTRLNEEKTQLMNMAAHDLRSPLTATLLGLEFLRMGHSEFDLASREAVGGLIANIRHMDRLIADLLDAQALEDGDRSLKRECVDLAKLLHEVVDEFRPVAVRKTIALTANIDTGPTCVHGDPGACRQILDNLLSNAIKYTPPGGRVEVTLRGTRFEVRDTGPGITAAEMERLFKKYGRLSARPTGGEPSIGLGLSIVKRLVDAMAGRVWCESEPGHGTAFIVEWHVE
jgi:two-component system, NarL family, sensor histidine kinase EvgS